MERQVFEALSIEEQVNFVNQRSKMTMDQIGQEIGMPSSSLSKIFNEKGYRRVKGIYTNPQTKPPRDDLQELLQYKDQLIALVLREQHQQPSQLNFSFLNSFDDKQKKTVTFDLPVELANQMEAFIKSTGFKKQAIYSLAIYEIMKKYQ